VATGYTQQQSKERGDSASGDDSVPPENYQNKTWFPLERHEYQNTAEVQGPSKSGPQTESSAPGVIKVQKDVQVV
jgi:hypothetical protein